MRVNSRSTYLMVVQTVAYSTTAHFYTFQITKITMDSFMHKHQTSLDNQREEDETLFLSLIGPDEWNQIFIGSFRLDSDDKWTKVN